MFCPNCGKAEQVPESYCRKCGEFLTDFSGKFYLLNKILGGQSPETQVTVNMMINLVTGLISALLLGFLNGYYDALYVRTQESPPSVIYLVYVFLGLLTVWQMFSFLIGMRLRSKISSRRRPIATDDSMVDVGGNEPAELREADLENFVPSVAEDTTRMLDRDPRRRGA